MESQDKEKEYEHNIWEIYRKEFAAANHEKRLQLNKRMRRWQELMKSGWTPTQAYYKVMEESQGLPTTYPFWTKMRKAFVIIPVLALAAAIVYGIVITREIDTLKTELASVQNALASMQDQLSSTKQTLTLTQSELSSTQLDLDSTKAELSSTKQILTSTQTELASTQTELNSTNQELSSIQQAFTSLEIRLSSTQQQLAVAQETLKGLDITLSTSKECSDVVLIDNPTATNPTWSELKAFLSQDQTEKHTYIRDVYDCSQFSRDVHDNAEKAGIRAAEVHVVFKNERMGHALNAFLTSDYGLVYVDCTGEPDRIVHIKAGKEYRAVELNRITKTKIRNDYWWDKLSSYYYSPSSTGGSKVTSSIRIYW